MSYITESQHDGNIIIQKITNKLYNLRIIEHSRFTLSYKYKKAKPVLNEVIKELMMFLDFIVHRKLWEELHDRNAFYYEYLNDITKKHKIPFFIHTLHNQVVPDWLAVQNKIKGPLLHFDTHDDMDVVVNAKNTCLNIKEIKNGACGMINHPVTCMVWIGHVDKVVWCMPKWVYDNDNKFEQALVINGKDMFYIRDNEQPKDEYIMTDTTKIVSKNKLNSSLYDFYKSFILYRKHVIDMKGWKYLNTIIDKYYILDIDLDFFACEGEKLTKKEYFKYFGDLCSIGRISGYPNLLTPRDERDNYESKVLNKLLNKEANLIYKRITDFLNGVKFLKSKGKIPCMINISDSAASFFSGLNSRAVITNSYCPKYLVPFIHFYLITGLNKIF